MKKKSTKISAGDIHEWIHDHLNLDESEEDTRHVNGTKRQVFVKFYDEQRVMDLVKRNNGKFACERTTERLQVSKYAQQDLGWIGYDCKFTP
jgi:hypothetical protein